MILNIIIYITIGWVLRGIIMARRASIRQKKLINNMNNWRQDKYQQHKADMEAQDYDTFKEYKI